MAIKRPLTFSVRREKIRRKKMGLQLASRCFIPDYLQGFLLGSSTSPLSPIQSPADILTADLTHDL